jgi:hypothetical protein
MKILVILLFSRWKLQPSRHAVLYRNSRRIYLISLKHMLKNEITSPLWRIEAKSMFACEVYSHYTFIKRIGMMGIGVYFMFETINLRFITVYK